MVSCLHWLGQKTTQGFRVKHVYSPLSLNYKRGRVRSLLLARLLNFYSLPHPYVTSEDV